jgi:hypothetical protein
MAKFDTEDLLTNVLAIMTANLNTKIAAIEAEKVARGFVATGLLPVDATIGADGTPNGYFEQTWSDKILNINPAIFYGIENIQAQGAGPATMERYTVFVEVVLVDSGMDALTKNRIHRYARALKEVFEENYDKLNSAAQIKIETVRPVSFKLDLNSSEEIKVGGISLTTSLA